MDDESRPIRGLKTFGIEWAYAVNPVGWDSIIDKLAKEDQLTFGDN